ncbi:MAG: vitamin B12 dependent methionine synthase [Deltaproteobacteria bacterium]|nr:vitamin B12 dependent methionine synthase [Deltaproteobacteria bacterium]
MEILDPIPIDLNAESVGEKLRVSETGNWEQFQTLFAVATNSIAAKAAYGIRYVDERREDAVVIDAVLFRSRVLRKQLEDVERVFPYVVTIGPALEERFNGLDDLLAKYYLDAIGNIALVEARSYLQDELCSKFALKRVSFMSPGSLEDWPIEQQKPLFSFFEGREHTIGVTLTDSCIMVPRKSVSGIYFPTETTFYNCQLCPRPKCVGRKAAYSEKLAEKYGINRKQEAYHGGMGESV